MYLCGATALVIDRNKTLEVEVHQHAQKNLYNYETTGLLDQI